MLYLIQNKRFAYPSQDFLPHAATLILRLAMLQINSVGQSDDFARFLRLRVALHFNPQNVVPRRG